MIINLHPLSMLSLFVNYPPVFDLMNYEYNYDQSEDYMLSYMILLEQEIP